MKRFNWLLTGAIVLCLSIVLLAGCGVSKDEYEALQAEKANVETQLAAAQSDLTSLQADYNALNADYQAASDELTDLNAVYPPKEFASRTALEDWLLANDVSEKPTTATYAAWYGRALEVQADALADGYIVSVDYDVLSNGYDVWCTTAINGDIYFWDPETDDVYHETGLTNVE
jgi:outer membrane murein-binding lipoprotein Lpp